MLIPPTHCFSHNELGCSLFWPVRGGLGRLSATISTTFASLPLCNSRPNLHCVVMGLLVRAQAVKRKRPQNSPENARALPQNSHAFLEAVSPHLDFGPVSAGTSLVHLDRRRTGCHCRNLVDGVHPLLWTFSIRLFLTSPDYSVLL